LAARKGETDLDGEKQTFKLSSHGGTARDFFMKKGNVALLSHGLNLGWCICKISTNMTVDHKMLNAEPCHTGGRAQLE
jgi:hypothetical protein